MPFIISPTQTVADYSIPQTGPASETVDWSKAVARFEQPFRPSLVTPSAPQHGMGRGCQMR